MWTTANSTSPSAARAARVEATPALRGSIHHIQRRTRSCTFCEFRTVTTTGLRTDQCAKHRTRADRKRHVDSAGPLGACGSSTQSNGARQRLRN
eukprot:6174404-Pleurochrysis_carterae.AAC.1